MRAIVTDFSAISASEDKWRPLLRRLDAQVHEDCRLQYGISDMYGPCIVIGFNIDDVSHIIYPDHNALFVDDLEKIIDLEVDDDWVSLRLKIANAPLRLDGPVPEPGPDLVQWLRQQMSCSTQMDGVSDSDWTFERCIREAAAHLITPPDQTSPDLPLNPLGHAQMDAAFERASPPGDAEALKLRLIEFGLMEPESFPELFPFLKWAASQNGEIEEELYQFFFEWAGTNREGMLRHWGVRPRNDDAVREVRRDAQRIHIDITSSINRWHRGSYHTAEMVEHIGRALNVLSELRQKVDTI